MIKGVTLGFLCYASYAISDAFVKLIGEGLDSNEILFLGAALMLTAVPFLKGRDDHWRDLVKSKKPALWLLRAMAGAISSLASVMAFKALSMAEAFSLIFLMPIFVTILSVIFLHEQVGWRRWSAVVVGFIGVLVVLRPGFRRLGQGHADAFVCALVSAISVIALRMAGSDEKRISLYGAGVIGPLVIGGIMMLPTFKWPSMVQWVFLLGYGLLAGLGAIILMFASRIAPASIIAPTQYSQMLWALVLGYILFHDSVDWPMGVGILLILGAGLFTLLRENQVSNWWKRIKWL